MKHIKDVSLKIGKKSKSIKSIANPIDQLLALNEGGMRIGRDTQAFQSILNIFADCHSNDKEERRCLNAVVGDLNAPDLLEAVRAAIPDGYNGFDAKKIEAILMVLIDNAKDRAETQRYLKHYHFRFGREGSPVLYIKCDHRIWADQLNQLIKASLADEASIEANGELRLWWD